MALSECACVWEGPPSNPKLVRGCVAHLEWRNAHAKDAREIEREECAKVAETVPPLTGPTHGTWDRAYVDGRRAAAKAIRDRA